MQSRFAAVFHISFNAPEVSTWRPSVLNWESGIPEGNCQEADEQKQGSEDTEDDQRALIGQPTVDKIGETECQPAQMLVAVSSVYGLGDTDRFLALMATKASSFKLR